MRNVFLTALASVLFGASTFFRKMTVDRIHPYQLQIVAGAVYMLEVPLWLWLIKKEGIAHYNLEGVGFGVLCILCAVCAAVLFSYLLRSTDSPSSVAVSVAGFEPLIAMAFTYLFLGEEMTPKKLIGSALTVAGISLLTR